MRTLKIHPRDNVAVDLNTGHKVALCDIKCGENIIKYGFPIGHATADISEGDSVHTHNLKTNLNELLDYEYIPNLTEIKAEEPRTIMAYVRPDGNIGIRNDIWIINTVGCVNKTAERLAHATGALTFSHPFGCSQLGGDHLTTQLILRGLVNHPNAGGVLVLGLGCENNNIPEFKKILGEVDENRVKFLIVQEVEDELTEGIRLINELKTYADTFTRQPVPISKLKVGLKCGGSDGLSGITANPLVGQFSDKLIAQGGSSVLTEVPEMFGAETILMNRCLTRELFDKTVDLINDFKRYFIRHGQEIYENPSPGNKAGGISTLEEKSLGCTQKGGTSCVVDVLGYGDTVTKSGLNLLNGPGNDIVAVTNLTAAGCHLILFTTGRGTPLGAPVPTVKISTNTKLYENKPHWIDFNAGEMINGRDLCNGLFDYVIGVCNGELTNNEKHGYREISIFKDGVTL
ncbi:MAG: altronate dehydratase [Oscillospiraceae bacterium]|nr:altronate dehydratase [Oscillospiraceae bacterium]